MLKLTDRILHQFGCCFKRIETFSWFIIIVLGMMLRTDAKGVTTIVNCMMIDPSYYETMLHFFKSSAFELNSLKNQWRRIVMEMTEPVEIDGKKVLIGDHIKVGKEARYMPGVKKHHQDSENVGKSEYIFGHLFGNIGLLAHGKTLQCIPLDIELHDGCDEIDSMKNTLEGKNADNEGENCIIKMIRMMQRFAKATSTKTLGLLDGYFPSGEVINIVDEYNKANGDEFITLVMRSKANVVAYEEPEKNDTPKRGRPRKYGRKIHLKKLFEELADSFKSVTMRLYDKQETVKYLCMDLLWKPVGRKVRFVLVKTNEKTMILMCTSFNMTPENIILAYSYRFKIEVSFKMLKHTVGGFLYHFWTKAMPKISRYKTKTDLSGIVDAKEKLRIIATTKAIEVYVFLSCVALGILTIISLNFTDSVWSKFTGWLRTKSTLIPSPEITRSVLYKELMLNFSNLRNYGTLAKIQKYQTRLLDENLKDSA